MKITIETDEVKSERCFKERKGTSKDNWATPQYFFDLLNKEFHFTLDPCSSDENHKCSKYYTEKENGLIQDWEGETVFVNPPFNQKDRWIYKCYIEGQKPNTTTVLIIPTTSDTKPWHYYVMHADEIRFCFGRVNFIDPVVSEKKRNGATFPLLIVIFRTPKKYSELHVTTFLHKNIA